MQVRASLDEDDAVWGGEGLREAQGDLVAGEGSADYYYGWWGGGIGGGGGGVGEAVVQGEEGVVELLEDEREGMAEGDEDDLREIAGWHSADSRDARLQMVVEVKGQAVN